MMQLRPHLLFVEVPHRVALVRTHGWVFDMAIREFANSDAAAGYYKISVAKQRHRYFYDFSDANTALMFKLRFG